jgi:putative DNA primase/helicase
LQAPEEIKLATAGYRNEQDLLGTFLAECCVVGSMDYRASASNVYAVYRQWCEETGESAVPQRRFGMALTEKGGFERYTDNGVKYRGLGIREKWVNKVEGRRERNERSVISY